MELVNQNCQGCGDARLKRLIKIAHTPVSGYVEPDFISAKSAPSFDLTLLLCPKCNLIQLEGDGYIDILVKRVYSQYHATYSLSQLVQNYMRNLLAEIHNQYSIGKEELLLEVGCNDGKNLEMARDIPCKVLGVEPSAILANICRHRDIPVIEDFFNIKIGRKIASDYGSPRIIIIRHVLEHAHDLQQFIAGLRECMNPRSILFIEVPYIVSILQGFHFEGIAHPHIYYFSVKSLRTLLSRIGIEVISAEGVPTDGGSILVQAKLGRENQSVDRSVNHFLILEEAMQIEKKSAYQLLARRIHHRRMEVSHLLRLLNKHGKRVYGFGAGKGHTILNVFGLESNLVQRVIDDDDAKHGMFLPGCGIEVSPAWYLEKEPPDYLLMLAPTHTDELKSKISIRFPSRQFKFIDIIPEIIIEKSQYGKFS